MVFDAFISYSSEDKAAADATCAVLESAGIRCWIAPRDMRTGAEYGAAIIEAIDHCRVMVLVFSSSANASRQIHREIERAVAKGLPILPVRIEEVAPTKSMEYFLGAIHWLDALNPPLEQHLQKLAETVKAMLKVEMAGERSAPQETPTIGNAKGGAQLINAHSAETAQHDAAPAGALPKWVVPAVAALVLIMLLVGGSLLYQTGAFAPRSTHQSEPGALRTRPTTLRAAAEARCFSIGAAATLFALRNEPRYSQVLAQEYNTTAPEAEMRFKRLRPTRTEFNFAEIDEIINFASSHGMKMRGYPLVVDWDLPDWLTKGNFSPTEISSILKDYVQTILRRYSGRFYSWDVVGNAFDDLGRMRQTIWQKAIGPDYVEQALRWAREADPGGKLFLFTDYSLYPLGASSNAT
jgi:hypothetical protein